MTEAQGAAPNIPATSIRNWRPRFSNTLYRKRNKVGRIMSKIKYVRCIATRDEQFADCSLAIMSLRPRKENRPL